MNTIQRQALTECHSKILKDLDLDADLAGKLIHHGVFNEDMIEDFKVVTTVCFIFLVSININSFFLLISCLYELYDFYL